MTRNIRSERLQKKLNGPVLKSSTSRSLPILRIASGGDATLVYTNEL